MTTPLDRPATREGLFLWIMHRFAEAFEGQAVLKGGMALRLMECPRQTIDIDYVFVPFTSKKEITDRLRGVLDEVEGAEVEIGLHSKMLRAELRVDEIAVVIEINVAERCPSIPMSTGGFARSTGHPARVVRIMSPPVALAHKLAAWNERRLLRDLYDCTFLFTRAGVVPDDEVVDARLSKIESRLPAMKRRRTMSRAELAAELREAVAAATDGDYQRELSGIVPPDELAGLALRVRASILKLVDHLEARS